MSNLNFDTLFLDSIYKDLFERYCIRQGLITKRFDDYIEQSAKDLETLKSPLRGIKQLLIWLTLFEFIDSNSSIYDFSKLVDIGLVKESNFLSDPKDKSDIFCGEYYDIAIDLMRIYKHDIIKHIKNKDKQELKSLQLYAESRDFWRKIDPSQRKFFCVDDHGNPLSLEKNYDEIIENVDALYDAATSFEDIEKRFEFMFIWNRDISLDIGSIRDNLMLGLYHSDNNKLTFASTLFSNLFQSHTIDCIDSIYYTVQASLPNEVNVMPMPQSLNDVLKMRNSPYIKSFRSVMEEWSSYINSGEYVLAEKIKKDLVRANRQLEKLEKCKKFSTSPYTRVFNLLGGQIPYLGNILGVLSFLEPIAINHIQKKNGWALLTKSI